jgi:MFS family permease
MASVVGDQSGPHRPGAAGIPRYAYVTLGVLLLANMLNYIDRQIPSILAQSIKADLKLDDAALGFLMGTAFAVFYAVVGIAMGRVSDGVSRKKLMALGLALWSVMTALGGTATSFATLSLARIGVGVGEATANPCSHSLLADTFPQRNRAAALGAYLAGTFIGTALALIIGGYFVQHWKDICTAVPIDGACRIANWKAALIAVGLPGIPLAIAVAFVKEPPRTHAPPASVGRYTASEFAAAIPPFTFVALYRLGGAPALARNLTLAVGVAVAAILLTQLTGDLAQWLATAIGIYAVVTWAHVQKLRDRPLFSLTFGCPTFLLAMIGSALIACIGGATSAWSAPYAIRTLGLSPMQTGLSLGLIHAGGSTVGVIAGGWLTDRWKQRDAGAPIWMATIALLGGLPSMLVMLTTKEVNVFLAASLVFALFTSSWGGAYAALMQDLVLPRMRGAAAAAFSLFSIVVASGAGPYWVGKISTVTGSLRTGMLSMQILLPFAMVLLVITALRLRGTTLQSRRTRAELFGEPALA